jgi:hypothetical protein
MMFDAGRGYSHDVDHHDRLPAITYLFYLSTLCFGQNRPTTFTDSIIPYPGYTMYGSFQVHKNRTTVVGWNLHTSPYIINFRFLLI